MQMLEVTVSEVQLRFIFLKVERGVFMVLKGLRDFYGREEA